MPQILTPAEIAQVYDQRHLCRCVPHNPDCVLCRRGFGYKFAPTGYAMDSIIQDSIAVDESKMAAKLVFAAGTDRDRKGDLFEVGGIDTSNHSRPGCAVVYLDHGRNCSKPIAKCFDPQNNYTVVKDTKSQKAWAWTYFCQGLKDAEDVFRLICGGFLASGSIGYRPIKAMYLPPDPPRGLPAGLHLLATDLVEVTWTGMPVNPEATRSMLEGTFGKSLSAPVRRTMEPFAAARGVWCPGITIQEKQMGNMMPASDPSGAAPREPEGGMPVDEDAKSGEKYGCQFLRAMHGDMGDMLQHYDQLHGMNEEAKVVKHGHKVLNTIHKMASETGMMHKSLYPEAAPLEHAEYVAKRKPGGMKEGDTEEGEGEEGAEGGKEGEEVEQDVAKGADKEQDSESRGEEVPGEEGDNADGKPKSKKSKEFKKEDKSLDLDEATLQAALARLDSLSSVLNQARPAGTV